MSSGIKKKRSRLNAKKMRSTSREGCGSYAMELFFLSAISCDITNDSCCWSVGTPLNPKEVYQLSLSSKHFERFVPEVSLFIALFAGRHCDSYNKRKTVLRKISSIRKLSGFSNTKRYIREDLIPTLPFYKLPKSVQFE